MRARLAELGYRPAVVTGDGMAGWPDGAPFDRIFVSFAVPRIPPALVAQLAPGGRALMTLGTSSPSWPGLAVITKTATGEAVAELRAVEFGHRGGVGFDRLFLPADFRERIATHGGRWTQRSRLVPPADTERGMWLALDYLHPGLVRHFGADELTIGAPGCGSWMRARPVGHRRWEVTVDGPRDIWAEIHDVADRWRPVGLIGRVPEPVSEAIARHDGRVEILALDRVQHRQQGLQVRSASQQLRTAPGALSSCTVTTRFTRPGSHFRSHRTQDR